MFASGAHDAPLSRRCRYALPLPGVHAVFALALALTAALARLRRILRRGIVRIQLVLTMALDALTTRIEQNLRGCPRRGA